MVGLSVTVGVFVLLGYGVAEERSVTVGVYVAVFGSEVKVFIDPSCLPSQPNNNKTRIIPRDNPGSLNNVGLSPISGFFRDNMICEWLLYLFCRQILYPILTTLECLIL